MSTILKYSAVAVLLVQVACSNFLYLTQTPRFVHGAHAAPTEEKPIDHRCPLAKICIKNIGATDQIVFERKQQRTPLLTAVVGYSRIERDFVLQRVQSFVPYSRPRKTDYSREFSTVLIM